jgi:hypothetical protein
LENPTREQAAEALGIHPTTLWRWAQRPEFQEALRAARRQAFSQSIARLQQASTAAVETLLGIMNDPEAPAGGRIRAAEAVLERSQKSFELEDLEVRLGELEELNRNADLKQKN